MQRIIDLIEGTLDAEITPQELADRAGYSLWHFLHLFQREVGMPLKRYRVRRQLLHALWHISQGMAVTDAALRWGFATHSGFYRACQQEFGCSPTAWLREHPVLRPTVPQLHEEVFRMLTRQRFREALSHWDVPADLPLTPVTYPSGHISDNAVYAGDHLVLKAYRDERSCRLAVTMAEALHARGIPAGRALPLPGGDRVLPIAGLYMTLCHRVPGEPLRATRLLEKPEDSGLRIGAALARLHQVTASVPDDAGADDMDVAGMLTSWALPRVTDALPPDFPPDYAARANALRSLPQALIHRDPNPSNLVDTGDAVGFIDFDLSARCARIYDPCYTATAVLSETFEHAGCPWESAWPVFCRALLEGYDSVTPLTQAEWDAVPTLLIGNELQCLACFEGSSKFLDVYQVNKRMLPWLTAHLP